MPRLDDIEQFKSSLRSIGKEPETLARWGETWQDLAAPAQGVPDDIAALLGGLDESLDSEPTGVPEPDFSIDSLDEGAELGALVDSDRSARQGALDETVSVDASIVQSDQEDEDFAVPDETESLLADFGSLLEPVEESAGSTGFESPLSDDLEESDEGPVDESVEAPIGEATPGDADTEGAAFDAGADEFLVPDSLLDGLDDAAEAVPEASDEVDAEEPGSSTGADAFDVPDIPDLPDISDPGSFGLDDLAALDTPDASGTDEFAMPEGFGEPAEAATTDEAPEGSLDEAASAADAEPIEPPELADDGFSFDEPEPAAEAPADDFGAMNLGSESSEGDSFDQFDLGGSEGDSFSLDAGISDSGAAGGSGGDSGDIDGQLAELDAEAAPPDTFSLDTGWEGDFTIPGFEMGGEAKPAGKPSKPASAPSADMFAAAPPRPVKQARAVDLTEDQVDSLQDTLLSYPLNLRLAVEDIIANSRGTDIQQADLIWMLVDGAKARDAARLAGQVLKRYIEVPAGFEKKTGAAFEAEKGSLRYLFVHSILPVLQVAALIAVAAGALFYLGYSFVYKPIHANYLYGEGYRQLELDKYSESVEFFDRAERDWAMKRWFLRYARGFAEKRQYARSATMYERLLSRWPKDTEVALEYASMESGNQAFEKAESVLRRYILERDYSNKDALGLLSRNYLDWADFEEQRYEGPDRALVSSLYEKARVQLATVMERHGRSDAYLELMLLYFIRTERFGAGDKLKEVKPLATYFLENKKSAWKAAALAELGEYLMDRNETDNVHSLLLAAVDREGSLPEAHAAMARWQRRSGFAKDELKALEFADRFFAEAEETTGLSIKRLKRYLDTLVRLGEVLSSTGRSLDAEDALNGAIDRYEKALRSRQLKRDAKYGKAYALLADIYFFGRQDYKGALAQYAEAELNGYRTAETDYRRGYIYYATGDDEGASALRYFYRAGLDSKPSPYLLWATANALYARDDYFAAQGYYSMLTDRLQFELDTLAMPSPQTKPSHGEIVQLLMMARNNLGVSLYRAAERLGDVKRRASAMAELTESARLFDSLTRDQLTMIRSDAKNLGFLNLDFVLHPMRGIDLAVYRDIPTSMEYPKK